MSEDGELWVDLVLKHTSSDNAIRHAAEVEFDAQVKLDPTAAAYALITQSSNALLLELVRQLCLIHLKRIVPTYWSIGFASFTGLPISQDIKAIIRSGLLDMAICSHSSKIRAAAAYAIVQIALADFPDEWPTLLPTLYGAAQNYDSNISMTGALTVLSDLFEDLITDDHFWDNGMGQQVLLHILLMIEKPSLSHETVGSALNLYRHILESLQSPEAFDTPERKSWVQECVMQSAEVFSRLLQQLANSDSLDPHTLKCKATLYTVLSDLYGSFGKRMPATIKSALLKMTLQDLSFVAANLAKSLESEKCYDAMNRCTQNLFALLTLLQHETNITSVLSIHDLMENLQTVATLDDHRIETYCANITEFTLDTIGLNPTSNSRENIADFLVELNETDTNHLINLAVGSLAQCSDWKALESLLFLVEALLQNEELEPGSVVSPISILELLTSFVTSSHHLVSARAVIILPRFYAKFQALFSAETVGAKALAELLQYASQDSPSDSFDLVKVAALVSLTTYLREFSIPDMFTGNTAKIPCQCILKLINDLLDEADGDGLVPALEALTVVIDLDVSLALDTSDPKTTVLDLIFKICFKDPSDVTFWSEAEETVTALLSRADLHAYTANCQISLPPLFAVIESALESSRSDIYSSELQLTLSCLTAVTSSYSADADSFPQDVFAYTFQSLFKLLVASQDQLIVQAGGGVLEALLKAAPQHFVSFHDPNGESGLIMLLSLVLRFLSPDLSDSASTSCGAIVALIIDKFQESISPEYFAQIVDATTRRLVVAREPIFIENMIMVFSKLVIASSAGTADFLKHLVLETDGNTVSGLGAVLPIWFEAYTTMRGYDRITENTMALCRLYSLCDERIALMMVDGDPIAYADDVIVTRLMAKSRPQKYTRIPAPLKIIKLMISELIFQQQQPDANDFELGGASSIANDDEDGDDAGWEEMEDLGIPTYNKLREYVDSDDSDTEDSSPNDGLLVTIITLFLKECASKNLGNFLQYYDQLSDGEKEALVTQTVFDGKA